VQIGAVQVPTEYRHRDCEGGHPCDRPSEQSAPGPSLQEKDKEQYGKDLCRRGDGYQNTGQDMILAQIRPAGGYDEQQQKQIELAIKQIAVKRKTQREDQRNPLIGQSSQGAQQPAKRNQQRKIHQQPHVLGGQRRQSRERHMNSVENGVIGISPMSLSSSARWSFSRCSQTTHTPGRCPSPHAQSGPTNSN